MAVCPPAGPVAPVENVDAPAPDALIACVGTHAISGELFSHWLAVAHKGVPETPPEELRKQVMEFLLGSKSLEGEASERGIEISDRAVRRELAWTRQQAYPDVRDFRQFLEDSGMTRSDIKYRVKMDMLSVRIRKDVVGKGSARTQERRFARFVARFEKKWKARTSCQAAYTGDRCGQTL